MEQRLLRLKEVQAQTGLGRATIYKLMDENEFPRPVKLTARAVAWPATEVGDWIEQRIQQRKGGDAA